MNSTMKRSLSLFTILMIVLAACLISLSPSTTKAAGPVCFYADINYTGASLCSGVGTYYAMPAGWNDVASSVRVPSGYKVEMWEHGNFGGMLVTRTSDQPWLGNNNFNDKMSMYRISTTSGCSGFSCIVTESQFNSFFPSRNGFYTYANLNNALSAYGSFATTGDTAMRKREVAAFLAHVDHETGGLRYIVEQNTANYSHYCDWGRSYGCPAGQSAYYGRGSLQLSWNYNYNAAGSALGYSLLTNPSLVQQDGVLAWKTGMWFWMTQTTAAGTMVPHNAIVNNYGFGQTIRTINGIECNGGNTAQMQSRVDKFNYFLGVLGSYAVGTSTC